MKNILVTGATGFIGKNLVESLRFYDDINVFLFCSKDDISYLEEVLLRADFVVHLAGVSRPKHPEEFYKVNVGLTKKIVDYLEKCNKKIPILLSSSTQAVLDNLYGKSKRQAEDIIFRYGKKNNVPVYVYRFPNLFGKWSKPNYNSVVATYCHNITHGIPMEIDSPNKLLNLAYVDDVILSIIENLKCRGDKRGRFARIEPQYAVKLKRIAEIIFMFRENQKNLYVPDLSNPFIKKLYSTYLSYSPINDFKYPLNVQADGRGAFAEFLKTTGGGQVSVNICKPGITKGNHWHHTKIERFLVVSGSGIVRFRNVGDNKIIEYRVSGNKLEVIDIPPGYIHTISNSGETDLITIIWANEVFNKEKTDTYFELLEID